jgi:hypothetical protein
MDETDDYPSATPDQRTVMWTLLELKGAEAIITELRQSHDALVEALEVARLELGFIDYKSEVAALIENIDTLLAAARGEQR